MVGKLEFGFNFEYIYRKVLYLGLLCNGKNIKSLRIGFYKIINFGFNLYMLLDNRLVMVNSRLN